jgi:hypothetical protein
MGMGKHVINMCQNIDTETGRLLERLGQSVLIRTADNKEGMQSFREKRSPKFTGDVVMHPHLVELGFIAFVEAAPSGHLFLKLSKTSDPLGPLREGRSVSAWRSCATEVRCLMTTAR